MKWLLSILISSYAFCQQGSHFTLIAGTGNPYLSVRSINDPHATIWQGFQVDPPRWVGITIESNRSVRFKIGHHLKYYYLPQKQFTYYHSPSGMIKNKDVYVFNQYFYVL